MKKSAYSTGLALAFTWFAAHCATGFATGKQYLVYYGSHGWTGVIMPILTWVILAAVYYYVTEYCRLNHATSYKDFANTFYINDKRVGWLFVLYWDLFILAANLIGFGGILSVGATALQYLFGFGYWFGLILTVALIIVGGIFGTKFMLKVNSILSYLLIATVFIVTFAVLTSGQGHLGQVLGQHMVAEGHTTWKIIWDSLVYVGLMVTVTSTFAAAAGSLKSRKETKVATWFGAALNCFMLTVYGLVTLSFFPEVNGESLPVLAVLQQLGPGYTWLVYIYQIVLYLAILTSGISLIYGLIARFGNYGDKIVTNDRTRSLIWSVIFLGIGIAISTMGWTAIVTKGYSFMSKLALPVGAVLVLLLGHWRLSQLDKKVRAAGLNPEVDTVPVEDETPAE